MRFFWRPIPPLSLPPSTLPIKHYFFKQTTNTWQLDWKFNFLRFHVYASVSFEWKNKIERNHRPNCRDTCRVALAVSVIVQKLNWITFAFSLAFDDTRAELIQSKKKNIPKGWIMWRNVKPTFRLPSRYSRHPISKQTTSKSYRKIRMSTNES